MLENRQRNRDTPLVWSRTSDALRSSKSERRGGPDCFLRDHCKRELEVGEFGIAERKERPFCESPRKSKDRRHVGKVAATEHAARSSLQFGVL